MNIAQIAGIAVFGTLLTVLIGQTRSELAMLLRLGIGVGLFFAVLPEIEKLITSVETLSARTTVSLSFFTPLIKMTAVCGIAEIASALCRDAGETALGTKVALAGKLMIAAMTVPILSELLDIVISILP